MFPATIPILNVMAYAFGQSDAFARSIVVILLAVSAYVWILMLDKAAALRRAARGNRRFLKAFESVRSPLRLLLMLDELDGPMAMVYQAAMEELTVLFDIDPRFLDVLARREELPRALTGSEIEKVRNVMERVAEQVMFELEARLNMVGLGATISPFLGLLGTVWGVMLVFCEMARKGRPDIRAMAPGVSGALLTTVVGLIVAIPAVIGYNLLGQRVRRMSAEIDNFIDRFTAELRIEDEAAADE